MAQLLRICFSIILAWGAGLATATAQKADPALFGTLPSVVQAEISPDGKTVAVLQNSGGQSSVVFVDLENPAATPQGVAVGIAKARKIQWVDDDYVLLLVSITQNARTTTGMQLIEMWRWLAISSRTQKTVALFKRDVDYYISDPGALLATTPDDPGSAIIARTMPNATQRGSTSGLGGRFNKDKSDLAYSLAKVDLKSGGKRITNRGNEHTIDWIVDSNGEPILRIDYDRERQVRKIYKRRPQSSTFELAQEISELREETSKISLYGIGESPNEVLATQNDENGIASLYVFDVAEGRVTRKFFGSDKYDIDDVEYDPRTGRVTGVIYNEDLPRAYYIDPELEKTRSSLEKALPGAAPIITSRSADGSKFIIRASYTDRPDEIYTFDKSTRNLAFFSSTAPGVADRIYGEKTKYDFVSPDGLAIDGYLTTPVGVEKSNMPLIVLPHGGPASRDNQSFDWWAFFYAARGYAVYQPNFRGSDGYGLAFREAGYGEWGRKMQDDISNGVKKLISDGVVDPSRICIVGASYGGYAALAGATLTPDLYTCAVSVNGVSDLPRMIGEAAVSRDNAAYWERRIGSRFRNADELAAVSPARLAASAGPPIMLIHGKDDTVVPFYQSEIMRDALAAANKPHVFVELRGEDHWLSSDATRTGMLSQSIEFIDEHIGGE